MTLVYIGIFLIIVVIIATVISKKETNKLKSMGLHPESGHGSDEDVKRLLNEGYKTYAIKLYRELNNVGLKKAKYEIEKIQENIKRNF